jgi:hypothetical protein
MHRVVASLLVVLCVASSASGCGERHPKPPANAGGLQPAPPPPPGSVALVGPLRVESIDVVRSEIGWDRDLVRASRVVDYDVVLAQERATCPSDAAPPPTKDGMGCSGVLTLPDACARETVRARLEVTVRRSIDVAQRCAGDATTYAVPASGDPRPALQSAGAACFRNKNKFKPEASWTSLYALTELTIEEKIVEVRTRAPLILYLLLDADAKMNLPEIGATPATFCREDGAFLDGTPGALPKDVAPTAPNTPTTAIVPADKLVPLVEARAPLAGQESTVGLTTQPWQPEQRLWEQCRAPDVKDAVAAQERCQLLRQLDRFLRDVEDAARPETPKGAASATSSASSASSASPSSSATPSPSPSTKKGAP